MHTVTFYDSSFMHKNPNLSPVHHMRCDLSLCSESQHLLTTQKLVNDIKKFPTKLHCVLLEMPGISFVSNWGTGTTTKMFEPISNLMNNTVIGKAVQLAANDSFVPLVATNEFSQQVLKTVTRPKLNLKFNVYTDTYNKRYNFTSSPYETWLKMLYFSTAPLFRATYSNILQNAKVAINTLNNMIDDGSLDKVTNTVSNAAALASEYLPFTEKDGDTASKAKALIENLQELAKYVTEYIQKSNIIGQLCWDVAIPRYLCPTNKSSTPILWVVESFTAELSEKFTRGILNSKDPTTYRPRPLYMTFNVTLEANQVMTREQYIRMLCGNAYENAIASTYKNKT